MHHLVLTAPLIVITAIWGWTFVIVKDGVESYAVVPFLAIRFAIGALVLAGMALPRVNRGSLRIGALIGSFLALGFLLQTFGLFHTTSTNCGLITGLFVVFSPLANYMLFGQRTGRVFWLAVLRRAWQDWGC